MDIRQGIRFMEESRDRDLAEVPEWAHAEHMEMSTPLKELWRYPDSFARENSIIKRLISNMRGFRNMKRKNVIICHSAEEMNRKADALIEQGYQVERENGVQPVSTICFPIYKIKFWK